MSTLTLSPMAQARIGLHDRRAIERRAKDMGVRVGATFSSTHGWVVHVYGERLTSLRGKGALATAITCALDDYAEVVGWTPDEILTVANQSGVPVSRG